MKEGLFFLFLFNFIPISAQYCCTEIGKVLHYTTIDKKQEKTLKDSALVRDVIHENERIVVDLKSATPFPKCYLHKEKWTFDS